MRRIKFKLKNHKRKKALLIYTILDIKNYQDIYIIIREKERFGYFI